MPPGNPETGSDVAVGLPISPSGNKPEPGGEVTSVGAGGPAVSSFTESSGGVSKIFPSTRWSGPPAFIRRPKRRSATDGPLRTLPFRRSVSSRSPGERPTKRSSASDVWASSVPPSPLKAGMVIDIVASRSRAIAVAPARILEPRKIFIPVTLLATAKITFSEDFCFVGDVVNVPVGNNGSAGKMLRQ